MISNSELLNAARFQSIEIAALSSRYRREIAFQRFVPEMSEWLYEVRRFSDWNPASERLRDLAKSEVPIIGSSSRVFKLSNDYIGRAYSKHGLDWENSKARGMLETVRISTSECSLHMSNADRTRSSPVRRGSSDTPLATTLLDENCGTLLGLYQTFVSAISADIGQDVALAPVLIVYADVLEMFGKQEEAATSNAQVADMLLKTQVY